MEKEDIVPTYIEIGTGFSVFVPTLIPKEQGAAFIAVPFCTVGRSSCICDRQP
jgi:hypothetical protein